MSRHYDYLAIGAGSGGIASANRAAIRGAKAAVIEAKFVGGTCVNVGCVPKKVMWYGAHIAEAVKYSPSYGFNCLMYLFLLKTCPVLKIFHNLEAAYLLKPLLFLFPKQSKIDLSL